MNKVKSVASVSFNDSRSISMDVEAVVGIELGSPIQIDDDQWVCELIVRSANGMVAIQMLADSPERFETMMPNTPDGE